MASPRDVARSTTRDAGAFLHVVAAVINDGAGRILIARRPDHLHQGGLWEFPGGKVESGESARVALARELQEELGIEVEVARPLITVRHAYPDKRVMLDVWRVTGFTGEPHGREGQPIRWVEASELANYAFPAANLPIATAARLPDCYLITPDAGAASEWPRFLARLSARVAAGVHLVQLRAHDLPTSEFMQLARQAIDCCHAGGAQLLVNAEPSLALDVGADGVHLSSARLRALDRRPLPTRFLVAASCHTEEELGRAAAVADFAVLSPVNPTSSHPHASPLGWEPFQQLVDGCPIPVYALGGVTTADLETAWRHGAQGIAAIRGLWDAD